WGPMATAFRRRPMRLPEDEAAWADRAAGLADAASAAPVAEVPEDSAAARAGLEDAVVRA
ncbi:hypothetical protein NL533_34430, partial [Klebsiella pneumoniae]|nr:hypothetical protein [Klebsiella pneumoniae]